MSAASNRCESWSEHNGRQDVQEVAEGAKKAATKRVAARLVLLAGGNPQIAKADGAAAVQAYIAAMPG